MRVIRLTSGSRAGSTLNRIEAARLLEAMYTTRLSVNTQMLIQDAKVTAAMAKAGVEEKWPKGRAWLLFARLWAQILWYGR